MSGVPPPSSFDDNTDFYQESRWQKLKRKLLEEPLIPLGCALTVWALFEANKSIKSGDKARTNRMFRRRIYAQGFTILAMVAGSAYWESDRAKRKKFDELTDEKKRQEKRDAWIKELEAREEEEEEMRRMRTKLIKGRGAEQARLPEKKAEAVEKKIKQDEEKTIKDDNRPKVQSVLEASERRRPGLILTTAMDLWHKR